MQPTHARVLCCARDARTSTNITALKWLRSTSFICYLLSAEVAMTFKESAAIRGVILALAPLCTYFSPLFVMQSVEVWNEFTFTLSQLWFVVLLLIL